MFHQMALLIHFINPRVTRSGACGVLSGGYITLTQKEFAKQAGEDKINPIITVMHFGLLKLKNNCN